MVCDCAQDLTEVLTEKMSHQMKKISSQFSKVHITHIQLVCFEISHVAIYIIT